MKRIVWVSAGLVVLAGQPAWAARTQVHEAAESTKYERKFGGMIGRGLLNVATCFVDVIVNVVNETKTGPAVVGTLTGVAKGAGCGVLRAGSGAIDLVTFWVPGFNGFPVSDSYENCLAMNAPAASVQAIPPASSPPATTLATPTPAPAEVSPAEPQTAPPAHRTKRKKWTK